jgi:hypothetical protein
MRAKLALSSAPLKPKRPRQEGKRMKVSIDVDCTPEEARRLVGLPDLSPLHAVYVGRVEELMKKGITPDIVESMIRNWVPMGESGMNMLSGLMSQFSALSGGTSGKSGKK